MQVEDDRHFVLDSMIDHRVDNLLVSAIGPGAGKSRESLVRVTILLSTAHSDTNASDRSEGLL